MKMKFSGDRFVIDCEELIQLFSFAFSRLLSRDKVLFESANQVQERTFMHRFACELHKVLYFAENYLDEQGMPILSLDVEYNRDGDGEKSMSESAKWGAPDIILHQRGSGEIFGDEKYKNDIFVCELKKEGSPNADRDRVKRMIITRKYQYGINFYKMTMGAYEFEFYWGEIKKSGKIICHGPKIFQYNESIKCFVNV